MRWGVLPLVAALFSALCSCNPEEAFEKEDVISPEIEGTESGGLVKMEFVGALSEEGASAEDDGEGRTYLSGNHVYWRGSDKIGVIDTQSPYVHEFDNTDAGGGAVCRFVGEAKAGESTWTVVYPASAFAYLVGETDRASVTIPAVQTAVLGGFADGSYITYCRTSGKSFTMTPLLSMFKIHISYENLTQIKVMSRENRDFTGAVRPLAGTFRLDYTTTAGKLNFDSNSATCMGTESDVTLLPPDGNDTFPIGDYYIPVAPLGDPDGTWNASLTCLRLEFTRSDGQIASRTASWDSENKKQLKRGKYFDLGNVDEGLSWDNLDICFGVAASGAANEANYRCPFVSWTNDDWTHTYDPPATMKNTVFDLDGNVVQFKLKDSGHILKAWTQNPRGVAGSGDDTRYANGSPALFFGSTAGSYLEFPAMRNRRLLRVEVQYDSTTTHDAKVGFPYVADRDASTCPRITDLTGTSIGYTMSRDGDGFHHNYILYDTELNTPYRYTLNYNGGNWTGPRVQRIRLYYSKEAAPALSLPALSASGYSSSLRESHLTINLTAANGALANQSAYDVGIVVKGDGVSISDKVIYLNSTTASIAGTVLTWETDYRIPSSDDVLLNDEVQFYPFARIKGDATDPLEMTAGNSGTNWVAGARTIITRPTYSWTTIDSDQNYLYVSDTSVELNATVTVTSSVTQNYDVGFIYKVAGAEDTPANWNCTYVDQNGTSSAFSGYELADGASKTFSATLTGLSAGQTYVYKPVIIQHAICYFGYGGGASDDAHLFKFLLYEDGYGLPNETLRKTISGPEITYGATVPQGYYITATTGSITAGSIGVAHVKSGSSVKVGWVYGTSLSPTTEAFKSSATTVAGTMNVAATSGTLTGLPDVDGSTVYFRPFFAFNGSSRYYYPSAAAKTFTCPTVSVPTSGDYLWRTATTADLKGTIAISDSNCKMEIGYSTNGGNTWTTSTQNLTAGAKTIGSASGITEGGQTVRFGARRSGSSNSGTWKSLSITLGQPITSVYTYGSSYWTLVSPQSVVVAGKYTVNKVASNACVEYGVQYYIDTDKSWSRSTEPIHTVHYTGTGTSIPAYVEATLTESIATSNSRGNPLIFWFFARLKNSNSTPNGVGAVRSGSSLSSTLGSSTFGSEEGTYGKRVMINFNTFYENSGSGGYVNPFLPASGYVQSLPASINSDLVRTGSAMLAGGHTLGFSLTSGASKFSDKDHPLSGVLYESNANSRGALRVYSNSVDDYIASPAIANRRVQRFLSYSCYVKTGSDYFGGAIPASSDPRVFCSSNDRNLANPSTGFSSASPNALGLNTFEDKRITASFASYSSTYNNTSAHLHFCNGSVTNGTYPTSDKKCAPWETRFLYIAFDYNKTGAE